MKTMLYLAARAMTVTVALFAYPALLFTPALVHAQDEPIADEENLCIQCHGNTDLWEGETLHLLVTPQQLAADIHWQKGIKCQACHGGNAATFDLRQAHAIEDGFRKIESSADVPAFCGHCHSNAEYMKGFRADAPVEIVDKFWSSVHGRYLKNTGGDQAASCTSCHPKHQTRAVIDPQSALSPGNLASTCGACHHEQLVDLRKSVHARAGPRNESGAGTLMDCNQCHGPDTHGMLPVDDPASPMCLDHQVRICGACHESYLATYDQSVHGQGLTLSGLVVTAVCSDCHGAHGIFYAADRRSTLHPANVAATCGDCHHFLAERVARSVHGPESGLTGSGEHIAPGGTGNRKPSCTDCHQGHDALMPESEEFRRDLPNRCGNCHATLADRYRLSLHGELTEFGYQPAAECTDCHGSHDILPLSDPASRMALAKRKTTCQQCHPAASVSFSKYDPHASYKDAEGYPLLHGLYVWLESGIYLLVGLFALHMLFWFTRAFFHARRFGRDRPCVAERPAITAFVKLDRIIYLLLIVAFIGLVLTGLPLKYGAYPWAKRVVSVIGGFQTTSVWHHAFALLVLVCCVAHLSWLVRFVYRRRRREMAWNAILLGPDSPIPTRRDWHDFLGMLKWFFGIGNKPRFERWAYWEKFDYWVAYAGIAVFGISGLMLWYPNVFCSVLPGTVLNVAKVVHSQIALPAAGFVFMIHVFNTHLRPEKFPLDLSWFTGVVSEEHLRRIRPDFVRRLEAEGRLESLRTVAPDKGQLRKVFAGAFLLLALALVVLGIIVVVSLGS